MDENINYLQLLLLENELNFSCLQSNVKFMEENQLFNIINQNNRTEIISLINTKLHNVGEERIRALHIMRKFLAQCVSDTFNDFALIWMQQCLRWIPQSINEELLLLCDLIENSVNNADVKKQIVSDILPRFVDRLTCNEDNASTTTIKLKLKCLGTFMDLYSTACTSHRNTFQKYVIHCMRQYSDVKQVVKPASTCFVLLCLCCNKGHQGINHKETWSLQFKALIDTGNKLFSIVYSSVDVLNLTPEVSAENVISGLLELNPIYEKNPIMRFHGWKVKFFVISKLLQSMLRCKYPVSKSFQPVELLNLVCRFLSVNEKVLRKCKQTNDVLALIANLSDMHEYVFDILRSLIACAKRNLIPYGTLICKLCLQSLKWTHFSKEQSSTSKPFQSLRFKVYNILSYWLSISDSSSSIEIFADEIIPIAISDIECPKPSVKLMINTKSNKKNKRKREHTNSELCRQPESLLISSKINNKKVCLSAHQMLQSLFSNASILIKYDHHKNLQSTIISLLIDNLNAASKSQCPILYSDKECRLQLLKTLFILTIAPHWKWKMSTSLTGKILELGANDCSIEIVQFCKYALNQLELIIHPRGPTLLLSDQLENSLCTETSDKLIQHLDSTTNENRLQTTKLDLEPNAKDTTETEELFVGNSCEEHTAEIIKKVDYFPSKKNDVLMKLHSHSDEIVDVSRETSEGINVKSTTTSEIIDVYKKDTAILKHNFPSNNDLSDINEPREESLHSSSNHINNQNEYSNEKLEVANIIAINEIENNFNTNSVINDDKEDERPIKKMKTIDIPKPNEMYDNIDVNSMLNDFVDILQ